MLPMIAANLLQSIDLLSNSNRLLADKAIRTFEVNEENLARSLERNPILVTALNTLIGYDKAAAIANRNARQISLAKDVESPTRSSTVR